MASLFLLRCITRFRGLVFDLKRFDALRDNRLTQFHGWELFLNQQNADSKQVAFTSPVLHCLHCSAHQIIQGSLLEVANSLFVDFSLPKSACSALTMNDMVEYHRVVSWCSEVCDRIRSRSVASSVSSHQVCLFIALTPTYSSSFEMRLFISSVGLQSHSARCDGHFTTSPTGSSCSLS